MTDAGLDVDDIALLDSLHRSGDLKLRVVAMANPTESNFQAMAQRGGWDTPRLKAQSFKFYMDGSLGSRGAALLEPYDDRPGHRGLLLQSLEEYEAQLNRIHGEGFRQPPMRLAIPPLELCCPPTSACWVVPTIVAGAWSTPRSFIPTT